ncbi:MAG: glutathione S-transferase family protein [Agarilytica sp.]
MDLYYFPVSPYSHKVRMALDFKNIGAQIQRVMPFDPEQRAAYRDIYPLGKLPLLKHDDLLVSESSIIIEYLDDIGGEDKRLIPVLPGDARDVRFKDRLADNYLSAAAIAIFFQSMRPESKRDVNRMDRSRHEIISAYKMVEEMLAHGAKGGNTLMFFHGEHTTMADFSLLAGLRLSQTVIGLQDFPLLSAYYSQHSAEPLFKALAAEADSAMEEFVAALSNAMAA